MVKRKPLQNWKNSQTACVVSILGRSLAALDGCLCVVERQWSLQGPIRWTLLGWNSISRNFLVIVCTSKNNHVTTVYFDTGFRIDEDFACACNSSIWNLHANWKLRGQDLIIQVPQRRFRSFRCLNRPWAWFGSIEAEGWVGSVSVWRAMTNEKSKPSQTLSSLRHYPLIIVCLVPEKTVHQTSTSRDAISKCRPWYVDWVTGMHLKTEYAQPCSLHRM